MPHLNKHGALGSMVGANSLQNTERFRLHVTARLHYVEIYTGCQIIRIEWDFVIA